MFGSGGVNEVHSSSVYLPTSSFGSGFSSSQLNGVALKSQHPQPSALVSLPQLTLVTADGTSCNVGHMVSMSVNPCGGGRVVPLQPCLTR